MPVEHGAYDGAEVQVKNDRLLDATELARLVTEIGAENGTGLHTTGRSSLITDLECSPIVQISSIDSEPARVRMYDTEIIDGELHYTDMTFDSLNMARLAYGLWVDCGPFTQAEGSAVPAEVATSGQEAIAAYIRTNDGYPKSRASVADMMDVRMATVSNYCNRVRWEPGRDREEQRLIDAVHTFDDQFTLDEFEARVDASDDMTHTIISRMMDANAIEKVDDDPDRWQVI